MGRDGLSSEARGLTDAVSPLEDLTTFIPICPSQSSLRQENVTVFGCLTHEVPLSLGDVAVTCSKGGVRSAEGEEVGSGAGPSGWYGKGQPGPPGLGSSWLMVPGS